MRKYFSLVILFAALLFAAPTLHLENKSITKAFYLHVRESLYTFSSIKLDKFSPETQANASLGGTIDNDGRNYDKTGRELFFTCKDVLCQVKYDFTEAVSLDKIRLLFTGNYPKDFDNVLFQVDNGAVITSSEIITQCSKGKNICDYYFSKPQVTRKINILLRNATYKPYGISEIQFFSAVKKPLYNGLFDLFYIWPRSLPGYIIYPILFSIIFAMPGFIIGELNYIKQTFISFPSMLLYSALGISTLSLVSLGVFAPLIKLLVFLFTVLFVYFVFKKKGYTRITLKKNRKIIFLYLVSIIFVSLIAFIRDHPKNELTIDTVDFYTQTRTVMPIPYASYEADYLIPFQSAINFQRGGSALKEKIATIYRITDRTPLLSFLTLFYSKAFSINFFMYQMLMITFTSLFIFTVYFFAKIFVPSEKAYIITMILIFSQFFLFVSLYAPSKTVSLFFIFGSAYYILKSNKDFVKAGLFMALAYLFHPFSLVYFLSYSPLIFLTDYKENHHFDFKQMAQYSVSTIIAFVSWFLFTAKLGLNNPIYWSVISQSTWGQATKTIEQGSSFSVPRLVEIVFEKRFWIDKFYNSIDLFAYWNHPGRETRLLDFHKATIPGTLGVMITFAMIVGLIRVVLNKESKTTHQTIVKFLIFFVVIPIVATILFQGFYLRMGLMWYLLGIIPPLLIIVSLLYDNRTLIFIAFLSVIENIFVSMSRDTIFLTRFQNFFGESRIMIVLTYVLIVSLYLLLITTIYEIGKDKRHNTSI